MPEAFLSGTSAAQGALFELKCAIKLLHSGKIIKNLGIKYKNESGTREFDIETATTLIECKSIRWIATPNTQGLPKGKAAQFEKIKSNLVHSKNIAENIRGKQFKLFSKEAIPEAWKIWLDKKGIQWVERC